MKLNYVGKLSIVFGLTWGFSGLDRCMIGYAAPGFMPELEFTYAQLGLIVTLTAIGAAIGAWVVNPLTEYYGRRKGSIWGNLGAHLFSGLTGLVQGFGQMVGIRTLMGIGFGSMYGPGFAAIAEESPPEKRGFWMGLTQSFWPLFGMGFGPIIAGYLLSTVGWRYGFFLVAIPGIILIWYMSRFMREPPSVAENIRVRKETGRKVLLHEGREFHIWDVFRYRNVILMTVVAVFTMAYLWVLFTFVPSFFSKVHGFSPIQTGWIMAGGGFLTFILQLIAPSISDKVGRKPVLLVLFGLGTLGGILFAIAPQGTGAFSLAIYFTLFCIGLSSFPIYLVIIPTESVPFTIAATAVAVPQGLGEIIGATVFPVFGGRIADLYGLTATMWVVVVCSALAFILSLFAKETAPRRVAAKMNG
ncbi:MFS transporter [Desulfatiglans anilini]|uniref:MFS transporter n=1 Tax=Desulfatiglans anilini TaxID=90728 RepID=UPI0004268EE9|nr:MFS transporter [Desulfatiglans anilini]